MALSSMTGFARSHGASGPYTFEWELKSVNAKGFDLAGAATTGVRRARGPRQEARRRACCRAAPSTPISPSSAPTPPRPSASTRTCSAPSCKAAALIAGKVDAVAPSVDGLLAIKGVVEVAEPEGDEEEDKAARAAAAEAFDKALADLVEMRKREAPRSGRS